MCAGETLSSEQADFDLVLLRPNTYLVLIEYLKDAELLSEFFANNCATMEVTNSLVRISSTAYLPAAGQETFDVEEDGMELCMDTSDLATTYSSYASALVK